ncbi:type IV secretion system protein [Falsigemmobacter faecalis]|uniref:Type IV secretion system protein n=1 Tax=Falsigemmobacter faecalis TaxID=2488730 RepID=A0A3P3DB89_9RHOB|nr:type IV secretion system protein [Falsigemmobacter faecalis]RRH71084.1 type IV secretion system protein [Falsigemmobacter faecalis]
MGVVSWMVGSADGFLASAAESQFGAVAGHLGTAALLMVTLSIIALFLNMAFQYRSMDGSSFFWYLLKLSLIGLFAFNWAEFNAVATAVTGGLDYIAGTLVASVGGSGAGAGHFAAEFDNLIEQFSKYLNAIGGNLSWMTGAILGGLGLIMLSLLGFLTGIVLIFGKMMLSLMLGLAPLMITLSLFDATKDYFHRWISTTVSYAFYPVVIAAMFSTVVGMANALLAELGDPASATNIGSLVPFFVMVFLAKGFVAATPIIVRGLSGNFMLIAGPAVAAGAAGLTRGLANTRSVQARALSGGLSGTELAGRAIIQTPAATRAAVLSSGAQIARIAERARRLGQ